MIIYDFYGLPGSGKSTISHKLANHIRKKGYSVGEPTWEIDRLKPWRRRCIKFWYAMYYCLRNANKVRMLIHKSGDISSSKFGKIKLITNICYIMNIAKRSCSFDYVIFDQGIAQSVISLFTENDKDNYNNIYFDLIKEIDCKIISVFVSTEITIACQRMNNRTTNLSRAEKINDDVRINMMNRIKYLCNNLSCINKYLFNNDCAVNDDELTAFLKK